MLEEIISSLEVQMRAALATTRKTFRNSGIKGTTNENVFADFLRQYIPRRLEVGNGEIIDSQGHQTGQTDVIIVSEDHPFTFKPNEPGLFFIEGVYGAGEVKTHLTSDHLENTLKNSVYFKSKLQISFSAGTSSRFKSASDKDRFYLRRPYFLFAYESQLTLQSITLKVKEYGEKNGLSLFDLLDAIFILDKGCMINMADGRGSFWSTDPNGNPVAGFAAYESEKVLFELFKFLSIAIPRIEIGDPILSHYFFPIKVGP
jgi:hypothetical protein